MGGGLFDLNGNGGGSLPPSLPPSLGLGLGLGVAFSGETPPLPPYPCVHLHAYVLCCTQSQSRNQGPIPAWPGPALPASLLMLT